MKRYKSSKRFTLIQKEVEQAIGDQLKQDQERGDALRTVAGDIFSRYSPKGSEISDQYQVAIHIFLGGYIVAQRSDWPLKKTAKQVCRGLLLDKGTPSAQYNARAAMTIYAALTAAIWSEINLKKTVEGLIDVIVLHGREKGTDMERLLKDVSRAAIEAVKPYPRKDTTAIEQTLMDLLEGRFVLNAVEA